MLPFFVRSWAASLAPLLLLGQTLQPLFVGFLSLALDEGLRRSGLRGLLGSQVESWALGAQFSASSFQKVWACWAGPRWGFRIFRTGRDAVGSKTPKKNPPSHALSAPTHPRTMGQWKGLSQVHFAETSNRKLICQTTNWSCAVEGHTPTKQVRLKTPPSSKLRSHGIRSKQQPGSPPTTCPESRPVDNGKA